MSFESQIAAFELKVLDRARRIHRATVLGVRDSIRDGSYLTGSPGQPEETGELKDSWQARIAGDEGHVTSNHPAAPVIEGGVRLGRPLNLGPPGGAHSMKLTIAGAGALVEPAVREVVGA